MESREAIFKKILYAEQFETRKKASNIWESLPEVKAFRELRKDFDDFKKTEAAFIDPIKWQSIAVGGEHRSDEIITYSVGDEWITVDQKNTMEAAMLNGVIESIEQVAAREWHVIIKNRMGEVSGRNVIRSINREHSKILKP